ncbi:hypothetical protein I3843_10G033800 [Carya illinoinensis]|nr:hypothetical protein I3843_10G033800 [Carya illinoinensis]KAG7958765.1 hypothetical protein I3843_10G033800 [Carya illinoinensis]
MGTGERRKTNACGKLISLLNPSHSRVPPFSLSSPSTLECRYPCRRPAPATRRPASAHHYPSCFFPHTILNRREEFTGTTRRLAPTSPSTRVALPPPAPPRDATSTHRLPLPIAAHSVKEVVGGIEDTLFVTNRCCAVSCSGWG